MMCGCGRLCLEAASTIVATAFPGPWPSAAPIDEPKHARQDFFGPMIRVAVAVGLDPQGVEPGDEAGDGEVGWQSRAALHEQAAEFAPAGAEDPGQAVGPLRRFRLRRLAGGTL